jgi:two-component system nitrogen regulation response regulator GlnG
VAKALELSRCCRFPTVRTDADGDDYFVDRMVGQSQIMQEVYKKIGRIAPLESTVLILGESGTGKELVARALHHHSRRKQMPFLAINCAALPEMILESELFGHERGAFTGADQRRVGKFEQVSGGTMFLDEIGDMSPAMQAKALRLLEEQKFERIGGNTTVNTDVRIIAATNRNLAKDVAEGRFRQDLFYRLNGFTIPLPPLRDRSEDIPALTEHFVKFFNRELARTIRPAGPDIVEILQQHRWPGNVREFQSAIRYAMVHTVGDVLLPEYLPETCLPGYHVPVLLSGDTQSGSGNDIVHQNSGDPNFPFVHVLAYVNRLLTEGRPRIYRRIYEEIDRQTFHEVMKHFDGNQQQASERLGICRITLRSRLRSLNLFDDSKNGRVE